MIKRVAACLFCLIVLTAVFSTYLSAQFRVGAWNVTNFSGASSRDNSFRTALYSEYQGRSFRPTILLGQEYTSAASITYFTSLLNTAAGSPGDWASAPFISGPDTQSAYFYRSTLVDYLGITLVAPGGAAPEPPRNVTRCDFRLKGYDVGKAPIIATYSSHMKAGSSSADLQRRLKEAQYIRANAETLDPSWFFIYGGDMNMQSSSQAAYQEMVGSKPNNQGRFFDPINTPGNWNNNSAFRFVHTQDPVGAGGMDDRHDQILLCNSLIDGKGLDYIGNPALSYSTLTWNDPNHSYRAWGNDGTSFDTSLTITGNSMVGEVIAQALVTSAASGGHLPVFLDLRLPAQTNRMPSAINFGKVIFNSAASASVNVWNGVDANLWSFAEVNNLVYSLNAPPGFIAPAGTFSDAIGGTENTHWISVDTTSYGIKSGNLSVVPTDTSILGETVSLWANVVPPAVIRVVKPANDDPVNIEGAVLTAAFSDYFYIESEDRASGIRVEKPAHNLPYGKVNVTGFLKTNADGERYIEANWAEAAGAGSVAPLGMTNKQLGGSDSADYDAFSGSGQQGVKNGFGLNNIGLLVRIWGWVTERDATANPAWFKVDDGSGINVRVVCPVGVMPPATGTYVESTGAASCYKVGPDVLPQVLLRSSADIKTLAP